MIHIKNNERFPKTLLCVVALFQACSRNDIHKVPELTHGEEKNPDCAYWHLDISFNADSVFDWYDYTAQENEKSIDPKDFSLDWVYVPGVIEFRKLSKRELKKMSKNNPALFNAINDENNKLFGFSYFEDFSGGYRYTKLLGDSTVQLYNGFSDTVHLDCQFNIDYLSNDSMIVSSFKGQKGGVRHLYLKDHGVH